MKLLLGVDGGGSKTRAIVVDAGGAIVAEGQGPSSNPTSVGFDLASAALREAVARTGIAPGDLAAGCFGLAGVDREEDRARMEAFVVAERFAPRAVVVHDSELVLAAGTPDGCGIGLICGTGSVAFGRTADGRHARAGGWGWLIGDEGSGYAIGVAALRAATQTLDGRSDAPALVAAIMKTWQLAGADDLIGRVHDAATTRADIARLAHVVFDVADAGDATARALVAEAAAAAALLVSTVFRRLGEPEVPLVLAGGLLVAHAGYRDAIRRRAGVPAERAVIVEDPARGAVALAGRLL